MKKVLVICAAAFIAIGQRSPPRLRPMPKIMAPPVFPLYPALPCRATAPRRKKPITIAHITITAIIIALIIGVTITIAAITENLMLFCLGADRDRSLPSD